MSSLVFVAPGSLMRAGCLQALNVAGCGCRGLPRSRPELALASLDDVIVLFQHHSSSYRAGKCYYAGKAKISPWRASSSLKEAVNLMEKAAVLRPKYQENMEKCISTEVEEVNRAIESESLRLRPGPFTKTVKGYASNLSRRRPQA